MLDVRRADPGRRAGVPVWESSSGSGSGRGAATEVSGTGSTYRVVAILHQIRADATACGKCARPREVADSFTRMRSGRVLVFAAVVGLVTAFAVPAVAQEEGPPPVVVGPSTPACTQQVVTFDYAGFTSRTFVVPDGVTQVLVDAYGAQGGAGNTSFNGEDAAPSSGGLGAHAATTLTVTPGESIEVRVGGRGSDDTSSTTSDPWTIDGAGIANGGYNGGGSGNGAAVGGGQDATLAGVAGGGGGGGASDIRVGGSALADRVLVAGGGGGGGSASGYGVANGDTGLFRAGGAGGAGGGTAGGDGTAVGSSFGHGGGAGTTSAAGTGGANSGHDAVDDQGGQGALLGNLLGGNSAGVVAGGGGGGGGWFGGGGGGTPPSPDAQSLDQVGGAGGGGGGASGPAGVTSEPGVRSGDGLVAFTYDTGGCPSGTTPGGTVAIPVAAAPRFTG